MRGRGFELARDLDHGPRLALWAAEIQRPQRLLVGQPGQRRCGQAAFAIDQQLVAAEN